MKTKSVSTLKLYDTVSGRSALRKLVDQSINIRRIPPQNIISRLRSRETNIPRPGTHLIASNCFYTNITPELTVVGVEKPPCFLRKFTPDGKYFIAFSSDQTSLEVYRFKGSQAAGDLLKNVKGDHLPFNNDPFSLNIRSLLFSTFFSLKHVVNIATNEGLNRECSLFTDDSKFVIVGSTVILPDEPYPLYRDMYQNNESLGPNVNMPLEDCSVHVVLVEGGVLCETKRFKCDKIYLSHNQGISLYNRTLAVFSVQHQTIHIFQLTDEGKLLQVRNLGRFCYEDDLYLISLAYDSQHGRQRHSTSLQMTSSLSSSSSSAHHHHSNGNNNNSSSNFTNLRPSQTSQSSSSSSSSSQPSSSSSSQPPPPPSLSSSKPPSWGGADHFLCSFKHRLLVHLYYSALADCEDQSGEGSTRRRLPLNQFHQNFEFYSKLKMWKMQLLDDNHLLIKYSTEELVSLKSQDSNLQPSFFAIFNIADTQFLAFYDNTSPTLLTLFEDYMDLFRNSGNPMNIYAKNLNYRFRQTICNVRHGNRLEAIKRVLAQLPISSQSYSSSPYLDTSLFSYDDKWLSALERPKNSGDHAIRFNARDSGLLKFRIFTGLVGSKNVAPPSTISRRLVAFTFHPFEPFAISVQRTNSDYVVNFHVVNSDGCYGVNNNNNNQGCDGDVGSFTTIGDDGALSSNNGVVNNISGGSSGGGGSGGVSYFNNYGNGGGGGRVGGGGGGSSVSSVRSSGIRSVRSRSGNRRSTISIPNAMSSQSSGDMTFDGRDDGDSIDE